MTSKILSISSAHQLSYFPSLQASASLSWGYSTAEHKLMTLSSHLTRGARAARALSPTQTMTTTTTYPQLGPAPVGDDVVDVPVVAQAQRGAAHERTHVQGQDGDEQRLPAFQVAVEQNGYKNDLQEKRVGRVSRRRGPGSHRHRCPSDPGEPGP